MLLIWGNILLGLFVSSLFGHWVTRQSVVILRRKYGFPSEYDNLSDWMGVLERLGYTFSIVFGFPAFIGIWLGMKAVGRWSRKGVLEYDIPEKLAPVAVNLFCVGNLISLFFGGIGALIILSDSPIIHLSTVHSFFGFEKIQFSGEFWESSSAIANTLMAIATFALLRTTVKSEKERGKREFIETVVMPVLAHLNSVDKFLRSSPPALARQTIENVWAWKGIRVNAGSIIYYPDKRVVQKIDDYDQELRRFDNFLTQQIEVFADLIREDFQHNVLSKLTLEGY